MIRRKITIRNHHSYTGSLLLLLAIMALVIGETMQESFFDYNYKNFYGENGKDNDDMVDTDDNTSDINDDENVDIARNIIPLQNGQDLDDSNDEAYILPISKPIGQVTGLGIDSEGYLLAFHRADRVWNQWSFDKHNQFNTSLGPIKNSTIYVIDPRTGVVVREFGQGIFYMPHGLTVDNDDNIWVTDVGSHEVQKYDKNFKLLLKLGEHLKPGSDKKHFCKPTDIAVAQNGQFFVADGYCNSRIMKFDQNGKLLAEFGHSNGLIEAADSHFLLPHSITLIEDLNLICVADRENERIQCFSAGISDDKRALPIGMLITKAESVGRIYAIREKKHYLVGVTESDGEGIEPQLFVMDMNNGKASSFVKGIENAHCLAISDDGTVYVGQTGPKQIVQLPLLDQE
uniref:peptidylamidoglycolate lyase n=1 Tax=Setaria digitata TaxID=48799 RepID=A0A915PKR8_9BILA